MKKILFMCYGGAHVNCLIQIIKKLNDEYADMIKTSAIGINLAAETFMEHGIPCHSLSHYVDSAEILETGMKYANMYHDFNSSVAYVDSCAYYGFSVLDLENRIGKETAKKVIDVYDRRLFFPVESVKRILKKESPDLLVVTSMHRFESAAIVAANEMGIPSLRIEDVLGNVLVPFPDKIQVDTEDEKKDLINKGIDEKKIILKSEMNSSDIKDYADYIYDQYTHINPTAFAVLCEKAKSNITKRGTDANKIFVTGHPSFDELNKVAPDAGIECVNSIKKNENDVIITLMSQPLPTREKTLISLIKQLKEKDNYKLIVKLHPNEDGLIQNEILRELDYDAPVIKTPSAPELTLASDIIITMTSTTGLEAAYLRKPVISLGLNNEEDFLGLGEMSLGIHVTDEEDIIPTIEEYLHGSERVEKIKAAQKDFSSNKTAVANICELIKGLL